MGEQGQVLRRVDASHVLVRMERTEMCANCHACQAGATKQEMLVTARNTDGAQPTDWVVVALKPETFLKAVGVLYGLPFLFLFFGCVAGYYGAVLLGLSAYGGLIGFALGLLLLFCVFYRIRRREIKRNAGEYEPVAYKVTKTSLSQ